MPKSSAADRVVSLLVQNGWTQDGTTQTEQVRIGTSKVPVYGGIGGELRFFGGRMRFHKANTDLFATVGRSTVSFYHKQDGQTSGFRNYATSREFDYIEQAVAKDATQDMPRTATEIAQEAAERARAAQYDTERAEAQAARQAALEAGGRILIMSGTKGRLYQRKTGPLVVFDVGPEEIPVCCRMRGRWLIQTMVRNGPIGHPDEHSPDCQEH